jgi:toxin ParE1/3/4
LKPVTIHPEALEEFDQAAAHFSEIVPHLGRRFFAAIQRLINEVRQTPATFRYIRKPARRHLSADFPYAIIYVERRSDIWILAVMHLRRKPGYWTRRLR